VIWPYLLALGCRIERPCLCLPNKRTVSTTCTAKSVYFSWIHLEHCDTQKRRKLISDLTFKSNNQLLFFCAKSTGALIVTWCVKLGRNRGAARQVLGFDQNVDVDARHVNHTWIRDDSKWTISYYLCSWAQNDNTPKLIKQYFGMPSGLEAVERTIG